MKRPVTFQRTQKGPCIFCREENVPFSEEHLPAETLVGMPGYYVLRDWVCERCNNQKLSVADDYFAKHYHGALSRVAYGITGKKGKGAEMALNEVHARFQQEINTVQLQIRNQKKKQQLLTKLAPLDQWQATTISIELPYNATRLGRCLAKMAVEIFACASGESVLDAALDGIREYALGRGKLKFLPFAFGSPTGRYGAALYVADSRLSSVPIALISLPGASYAVQLLHFEDLEPLRSIATSLGLLLEETPKRHESLVIDINFEFPSQLRPDIESGADA